ncbi:uroporphyrinogen-III synthase [Carboxylicivirga taeanensis]|uniref:uroporphyrinogen-III synthase n=1 Tax=Carboxylicivirga taeanensis TaxID=1416875 RepID=UPI003F6E1C77
MNPTSRQYAVILTHPMGNEDLLYKGLVSEGVEVVCDPMIDTTPVKMTEECRQDIYQSRRIIFTSKRAVEYFFEQMTPADVLDKSFICIGKKTAQVLESHGVKPWWVSSGRTATDLVKELQQAHIRPGEKWLALLGELAENTLEDGLRNVCDYKRYNLYRTIIADQQNETTIELLRSKKPLMVVCTSPSCFNGFMGLYSSLLHSEVGFASIGPATTKAMKKLNVTPEITAPMSTYEGLWQEMKHRFKPEYL